MKYNRADSMFRYSERSERRKPSPSIAEMLKASTPLLPLFAVCLLSMLGIV